MEYERRWNSHLPGVLKRFVAGISTVQIVHGLFI